MIDNINKITNSAVNITHNKPANMYELLNSLVELDKIISGEDDWYRNVRKKIDENKMVLESKLI